jgi:hypothetical protein
MAPAGLARPVARRRRGLPNGRAVTGGLLVALAGLLAFAAATGDSRPRGEPVVVAQRPLAVGVQLTAGDLTTVRADLPDDVAAVAFADVDALVGAVTLGPIGAGELIQRSAVAAPTAAAEPGFEMTVTVDAAGTVPDLRAGERIDVLATYGSGSDAYTIDVVRAALVLDTPAAADGALTVTGGSTVTIAVTDHDDVLAVTHAERTGTVTLVRATYAGAPGAATTYRPPGRGP